MRLIGNKTRLLGAIESTLVEKGVEAGTLIDIFAGTSSVGRHFKRRGFRVLANDRLAMCHARAVASIEVSRYPAFLEFRRRHRRVLRSRRFQNAFEERFGRPRRSATLGRIAAARPLLEAILFLDRCVESRRGLVFRNFAPGGPARRGYFRDENAVKIDGILEFLRSASRSGGLTRGEFYLLLSALVDAADRVANISGTYGAYLKHWQQSSLRPLDLEPPEVVRSPLRHRAFREDANRLIPRLRGDLLYVDPPYNRRQYAANYHVLDIISEYHEIEDLDGFEESLYGKTGLRPYGHLKSSYCVPRGGEKVAGGDVLSAMTDLILSSRVRHVVVSYNEEGLLTREEIASILARFSGDRRFDLASGFRPVTYKRFRSDSDRDGDGAGTRRSYRVLEGRRRDEIAEWLFFASREATGGRAVRSVSSLPG